MNEDRQEEEMELEEEQKLRQGEEAKELTIEELQEELKKIQEILEKMELPIKELEDIFKNQTATPPPSSWRDRIGLLLRENRIAIAGDILLVSILAPVSILYIPIGCLSLWLRRDGWQYLGMVRPVNWWRTVLIGIAIGVIYPLIVNEYIIGPLLRHLTGVSWNASSFASLPGNLSALFAYLVITWTLTAFGEELFFRGYLLNRLTDLCGRTFWGWGVSMLISSIIFALCHGYQGITGVLSTFFFGLLMTGLYLITGRNLWLGIITHGIYDTIAFISIFLW